MLSFYLLGRLALVAGFYLLRFLPVVGLKASERYEDGILGPVVDDVELAGVSASFEHDDLPAETTFALRFANESRWDAMIAAVNVRIGYSRDGRTVHNFAWADSFDRAPKNVRPSRIDGEGEGELELEFVLPDRPAGADDAGELWLDGSVTLRRAFEPGGRRLALGERRVELGEHAVRVGGDEDDRVAGEAEA